MIVTDIQVDKIFWLENMRMRLDEKDLASLMESIKQDGLIHPIGVTPKTNRHNETEYYLVDGHRRFEAIKKLGWRMIPANILPYMSRKEIYILNGVENMERLDLSEVDKGLIFNNAMKEFDMTESEVASRFHTKTANVKRAIKILENIPNKYKDKIRFLKDEGAKKGYIPATAANKIINMRRRYFLNVNQMDSLLDLARRDGISIRHFEIIGSLMQQGLSAEKAIDIASQYIVLNIRFPIKISDMKKLKQYTKKSVNKIVREIVSQELKSVYNIVIPRWKNIN